MAKICIIGTPLASGANVICTGRYVSDDGREVEITWTDDAGLGAEAILANGMACGDAQIAELDRAEVARTVAQALAGAVVEIVKDAPAK